MNMIDSNTFGQGQYVGYYWYSDQTKPVVLKKPEPVKPDLFSAKLPFIVEAAFFDPKSKISIQIRNIDGSNFVQRIDLSSYLSTNPLATVQHYKSHDLLEVGTYKVVEAWKEVKKDALAGMKTLEPAFTAFAGFGQ